MNTTDLASSGFSLVKGEIHRLSHARGSRIEALSGCLWVTMDHDPRDVMVAPGHGFEIDADGDTLVSALSDARWLLLAPAGDDRDPGGALGQRQRVTVSC